MQLHPDAAEGGGYVGVNRGEHYGWAPVSVQRAPKRPQAKVFLNDSGPPNVLPLLHCIRLVGRLKWIDVYVLAGRKRREPRIHPEPLVVVSINA